MAQTETSKYKLIIFDTTLRDGEQVGSPHSTTYHATRCTHAPLCNELTMVPGSLYRPWATFEGVRRIASEVGHLMEGREKIGKPVNVKGADMVVFSAHCHNDLGLATANSLAGIRNGARQIEGTINGIGERAGNAALEEIVMAVHTHPNVLPAHHELNIQQFYPLSRMVSELSELVVLPNKAIVGRNAFLHESGIHQDGVLKNRQTYEIMTPESVGVTEIALVLGKHSGRNALRNRGAEMGYTLDDTSMQKVFVRFKALCDKKKIVCDEEIRALFTSTLA
ncbi:hypothetical protein [Absidia glauca]|uniref:2-isopropylmalate synthase n=1 Tax=Absidia glauca TaxID=4829 RepID=A0A168M1F2_ABSGL|nr:hypothetical protein [Absidia glauca]